MRLSPAHRQLQELPAARSAAMVVPMSGTSRRSASVRSWRLTSCNQTSAALTRCSRSFVAGRPIRACTARLLANSPSVCPPMPSATAQSPCSDWSRQASSLTCRTRPGWEREAEVQRNERVSMLTDEPSASLPLWLRRNGHDVRGQRILTRADVDRGAGGRVVHIDVLGLKRQVVGDVVVGLVEVDGRQDRGGRGPVGEEGKQDPVTGTCAPDGRHGLAVQGTAAGKIGDGHGGHDGDPAVSGLPASGWGPSRPPPYRTSISY